MGGTGSCGVEYAMAVAGWGGVACITMAGAHLSLSWCLSGSLLGGKVSDGVDNPGSGGRARAAIGFAVRISGRSVGRVKRGYSV